MGAVTGRALAFDNRLVTDLTLEITLIMTIKTVAGKTRRS
jgi:hypothetical protein